MNTAEIFKQSDIVQSYFIRFPISLIANQRYRQMSLEAKVMYALLLNRMTLSMRNNWVNEKMEVYLIYTREEAAHALNITYKKSISAFKELIQFELIIEQRRGRGLANHIYIVKVDVTDEDAADHINSFELHSNLMLDDPENVICQNDSSENTDFSEELSDTSIKTCQNSSSENIDYSQELPDAHIKTCQNGSSENNDGSKELPDAHIKIFQNSSSENSNNSQGLPNTHIKTCQNGTSRPADMEVQDMPKQHPSNINIKNINLSEIDVSQSIPRAHEHIDGQADDENLEIIFNNAELEIFSPSMQMVFKNAIERLYYSEGFTVGTARLPQQKIRSYLNLIDSEVITNVFQKLKNNTSRVKNPTAYMMSTMFNEICEKESGLLINLPPEYVRDSDYYASD